MGNPMFLWGASPHRREDDSAARTAAERRRLHEAAELRRELGLRRRLRLSATVGDRFGNLRVVALAPRLHKSERHPLICVCDCGRERRLGAYWLVTGLVTSCHVCSQMRRVQKRGHVVRMQDE